MWTFLIVLPSQGDDHALQALFTLPVRADAAPAAVRPAAPTYRFTIVSVSATLNALRKQLYYELQALDLRVLNVRISREESDQLASTTVTLLCPPQLRGVLNAVALRLGQSGTCAACIGKTTPAPPSRYCPPEQRHSVVF